MLHSQLGNERFYQILRTFLEQSNYGHATTDDFRRVVEQALGSDMEWFFRQWIYEGGVPEIKLEHKVQKRGETLLLAGSAKASPDHPFKKMAIPIVLEFDSGQPEVKWIAFENPETKFEFELSRRPKKVRVDPARNFLAVFK
jgi:aminopeptidase N